MSFGTKCACMFSTMIQMTLYLPDTTPGVRRFIGYARAQGYEPVPAEMKQGDGAITLVYRTDRTYFLVFQRFDGQRIPRSVTKRIISGKYLNPKREFRIKDLESAYEKGTESVANEMQPGYMTPFVSERFTDFTVCLDRTSFDNCNPMTFPVAEYHGIALPAQAIRDLLAGLYGKERVNVVDLLYANERLTEP